jgi:hypothetical protein
MNIIPKEKINEWNDKSKIQSMKHSKSIRQVVNPPKQKRLARIRQPREHTINPRILFNDASQLTNILRGGSSVSKYNEYKESLKKSSAYLLANAVGSSQDSENIKQKLQESQDIATICSEKIMDWNGIENEWVILCVTILGKLLESKIGV